MATKKIKTRTAAELRVLLAQASTGPHEVTMVQHRAPAHLEPEDIDDGDDGELVAVEYRVGNTGAIVTSTDFRRGGAEQARADAQLFAIAHQVIGDLLDLQTRAETESPFAKFLRDVQADTKHALAKIERSIAAVTSPESIAQHLDKEAEAARNLRRELDETGAALLHANRRIADYEAAAADDGEAHRLLMVRTREADEYMGGLERLIVAVDALLTRRDRKLDDERTEALGAALQFARRKIVAGIPTAAAVEALNATRTPKET